MTFTPVLQQRSNCSFSQYAEALHGQGKEAEKLLDEIVERKSTLRETYRTFYESLLTERNGVKTSFVWADEAAAVAKQPLAAVQITPQAAKGNDGSKT